ncbi:MAG TPA: hypothetical protein VMU53_07635 [Candidatus Sulfotelmatobacter sp.]|nr:hypothetical protein [Candidatus Sulfotelmatobacter sp.]
MPSKDSSAARIYANEIDRASKLRELGVSEAILREAVERGQAEQAQRTLNHPPLYRGLTPWGEITCAFREQVIPLGWKRDDDGNLAITINDKGTAGIVVATGDEFTGDKDESPCTKSPRGPRTERIIKRNRSLAETLFGDIRKPTAAEIEKINAQMTWFLLFSRDEKRQLIQCELSLPSKINRKGRVEGWLERIILEPVPYGGEPAQKLEDVPQTPEIDIDLKRRNA